MYSFKQKDLKKAPVFIEKKGVKKKILLHLQTDKNMILNGDKVIEWHDSRRGKLFMIYRLIINKIIKYFKELIPFGT